MRRHPHPGELLKHDVLDPLHLSITEAAARLGTSRTTYSRVLGGNVSMSPDLAVRLERAGVSTARFWLTLQTNSELSRARRGARPEVRPLPDPTDQ